MKAKLFGLFWRVDQTPIDLKSWELPLELGQMFVGFDPTGTIIEVEKRDLHTHKR